MRTATFVVFLNVTYQKKTVLFMKSCFIWKDLGLTSLQSYLFDSSLGDPGSMLLYWSEMNKLGSNKTWLHQSKTKSMWWYLCSFPHTNHWFNLDQCNNKKISCSRGNSNKYDCNFVRPQSFELTKHFFFIRFYVSVNLNRWRRHRFINS